ncbi:MAG: 3-isopropylmalate dehydratase small subunit [Cyanobacteria bacterium K_DeepCast_35m_m2_023]|nr:3-isopropylmalate dehydratase small subunit [Cyanobacteria bacterium K_DeepCast_35m_m2_023]
MTSPAFPTGSITSVQGRAVAVRGDDIDTDRIIPARFLKCVTFDALGPAAFADDRAEAQGDHPFDRPDHAGASLLVVNRNFGCGSSREHAPQALMRWGIRTVIGESFAEIFFGNCLALGIPCLSVDHATALAIQATIEANPALVLQADLPQLTLTAAAATGPVVWPLMLVAGPLQMLSSGQWDATGQLLAHRQQLAATVARLPYLQRFATA